MSAPMSDMIGQRFGSTIVRAIHQSAINYSAWAICECDCGRRHQTAATNIRRGLTTSCGCRVRTCAGQRLSPTYRSWVAMKSRCNDPSTDSYKNYGGKGITVCDRWNRSFRAFLADMGERPAGMTIDRIDGTKNYEPTNCRWATATEQAHNRSDNQFLTAFGETKLIVDWTRDSRCCVVKPSTIVKRIKLGWSPEKTVTYPVRKVRAAA